MGFDFRNQDLNYYDFDFQVCSIMEIKQNTASSGWNTYFIFWILILALLLCKLNFNFVFNK